MLYEFEPLKAMVLLSMVMAPPSVKMPLPSLAWLKVITLSLMDTVAAIRDSSPSEIRSVAPD